MKKCTELTRLLDYMEENIDLDHIREIEQLQYDAIHYKPVDRLPLTITTKPRDYALMPQLEALENPERMLFNEILWSTSHSAYNSVRIQDDGPLTVCANFGAGIIASMFGCRVVMSSNHPPRTECLSWDETKRVFSKGVPDVKSALGKRVMETYQYYHERLKAYPKCYDSIHITQPELRGPYDTLRLIVGNDADRIVREEPAMAKEMVKVIAKAYVAFRKELDPLLTDVIDDAIFVNGWCCGGKVLLRIDEKAAQSGFSWSGSDSDEPNAYILGQFRELGGASLELRDTTGPLFEFLLGHENIRCVHYGNIDPDISQCYAQLKEKNIAIVGWGLHQNFETLRQSVRTAYRGGPAISGLTLTCSADDWRLSRALLEEHKRLSRLERK